MLGTLAHSVLEAVPCAVVLMSQDGRVTAMNARAEEVLGNRGVGRSILTLIRAPQTVTCIEQALRESRICSARHVQHGPTRDVIYRVVATPVSDDEEGGVCVTFEDVTDQERAGQMRRDFVANVSHELKTPLTSLLSFIETLRAAARDDPAARERFLAIMEKEATRMSRLVSDLLSLSRVEGSARQRPSEPQDIAEIVRSTLQALRPAAEAVGTQLVPDIGAGDWIVPGDADQLQQVLTNLVENAIKYGGPDGHVTVALHREERALAFRGPAIRIDVRDRGEGFDPLHIPRLTERFYRIDDHRSREQGGTGLGLAIAKHVVSRHRGRLRISSSPGQGSEFSVLLPAFDGAARSA